jgi:hypothetical protein
MLVVLGMFVRAMIHSLDSHALIFGTWHYAKVSSRSDASFQW